MIKLIFRAILITVLTVHSSYAATWGDIGTVGTLNNNKLCYTDGVDIICDAGLTVNGAATLDVSGTVSATAFVGDGSALTGVVATGADWYGLTNIPTGVADISNTALITAELQQLQNIDTTTISAAQFGYVGTMDQAVATTNAVTFADVSVTTNLDVAGDVSVTGRFDVTDISATGIIQATTFIGDGSALTGVVATSITLAINGLTDAKYDGSSLFLGSGAGASDDGTANQNTAVGFQALNANTTGFSNVANGNSALGSNTTGTSNVANGYYALNSNTTGSFNVANGYGSLISNTTGSSNVANGYQALNANTTGNNNVANGYFSLGSNTTGSSNVANGNSSLFYNSTGSYNVANGYQSLLSNTTGNSNLALGYKALFLNTSGNSNLALGYQAQWGAFGNSTGSYNVSLGHEANKLLTTGNNNIAIGASVTVANVAGNDQLNIGNTLYGDLANDLVGIGTSAPAVTLDVSGTLMISNGGEVCNASTEGAMRYTTAGGIEYCNSSAWGNLAGATQSNIAVADTSVSIVDTGTGQINMDVDGVTVITATQGSVDVSGTVKVAGTGSEVCGATSDLGKMRWNPTTNKFQICRQ